MPTTKSSTSRRPDRTGNGRSVDPGGPVPVGSNLVVLRGTVSRDPDYRVLPSGTEVLSLDLTVRADGLASESVPVVWHEPAVSAARLQSGDDVVVVGRVRRRFYRVAGATSSRTEVHADKVLGAGAWARIRALLGARLDDLAP